MKLCLRFSVLACTIVMAISAFANGPDSADAPFQIRYASNLNIGDSYVNISNTGASITKSTPSGDLCVNVYAFSPDEQMIECCSCPVTPDGLVSLSVKKDLTDNPLTGVIVNSVVIKLLASAKPSTGSCDASNFTTPAPGLTAWGTTLHLNTTDTSYTLTETPFTPATLSAGEHSNLASSCGAIHTLGSGAGICRSCKLGGLASTK